MEAYEYQTPFHVGETTPFKWDFTNYLDPVANETIVSGTWSIKCLNAIDSQIGSMLGSTFIIGAIVGQNVTGGKAGNKYLLKATVITSGGKTRIAEGIFRAVA